jgi:hypothetical protein
MATKTAADVILRASEKTKNPVRSSILDYRLPFDALYAIIMHLNFQDRLSLSQCCQAMRDAEWCDWKSDQKG